jgi:hypothetical protein
MKVLDARSKPRNFKKKVVSCDWFVMDLMNASLGGSLDEVEQVVKMIKDHHSSPTAEMKE